MATKMTESEVSSALKDVPQWSEAGEEIQRTYEFKDFAEAMRVVQQVADAAEDMDHHPDILIRYNKVTLTLSTHSAGGITDKDFQLAQRADAFA